MKLGDFKPGVIITGPKWPEPIEIKRVENFDSYLRIIGATIESGQHMDQILNIEEISDFQISNVEVNFNTEPWKAFLALETKRYRFASLYDPLLAMNASKVDPLPHQIEAVYGYVLKLPRIRFLIADDPGAGKTIMAGLIIKELKLRRIAKRILIVVPGHLRDQWIRELKDRFEETFTSISRAYIDAHYGESVWERENQIITSMDFIKRKDILPSISSSHFDLIIVDEAHKMSAYKYGDNTQKTDRYELGEVLSRNSEHLLFLTATPHKGDPENFRLFIDLLEPGFFADTGMLKSSINSKENPLFIRRIKEDLKDFNGRPLFLPRIVETPSFDLSDAEKDLYNDVSRYVHEQYNKALAAQKKRNVTFALIILQRRLASSTYALLRSLERRRDRLNELVEKISEIRQKADEKMDERQSSTSFDFEEIEDLSEEERWKEEAIWETLSVAENGAELEREIVTINDLIIKAQNVIQKEVEVKLQQLKDTMQKLQKRFPESDTKDKKILIFTESKDTLDYLEKRVRSWGYSVSTIHGGMKLDDRIKAESIFRNETQIMVATEAAGEGINLQFCHLMINYDLPWNPNRLEQRMGRVHRYGQQKEVYIFNLVAQDTREGKVLKKLFDKLEEIRRALRSDKVFDVIGEVFYDRNLSQMLVDAAANARDIDEILEDVEIRVDEEYISKVKENLGESLATRYIDYTQIKEMAEKAREYRLIPEYTRAFFIKAFSKAEGKFRERKDGFLSLDSIPYDIRSIAEVDNFKRRFGSLIRSYPKVTFDKEIAFRNSDAEFVSFGHPLFEAILEWIEKRFGAELQKGATLTDPSGKLKGYISFYEGELKDGKGEVAGTRLFSNFMSSNDGEHSLISISPSVIWDLSEKPTEDYSVPQSMNYALQQNTDDDISMEIEMVKRLVLQNVISDLEKYKLEIEEERKRQTQIKEKYGLKSLDQLIVKLDGDLVSLNLRKEGGENVDIAIRNKEEQKKRYEDAMKELEESIRKERNITMSMPKFVGIVKVRPAVVLDDSMKSDPEVEKIGMTLVMEFERMEGRIPEDVSSENLGFDIRSKSPENDSIRYIEVKARSETGAVALTQNEWFKAQRFGDDYYLHVVFNAGLADRAEHHVVQNPAMNVQVVEKLEAVRYIVSPDQIKKVKQYRNS
jgi:SNF2 family DNA or RNA helicase